MDTSRGGEQWSQPTPTTRSSRKADTQERILAVSGELFASRGYQRTSISMIATRAGVSRATIFWHFNDKAALFRETCRNLIVPFREAIDHETQRTDPYAAIKEQIESYERFVTGNGKVIQAFASWVFSSPEHAAWLQVELSTLHADYVRNLGRCLRELIRDPEEVAIVAETLASLLHGNMLLELGGIPPSAAESRSKLGWKYLDDAILRSRAAQD